MWTTRRLAGIGIKPPARKWGGFKVWPQGRKSRAADRAMSSDPRARPGSRVSRLPPGPRWLYLHVSPGDLSKPGSVHGVVRLYRLTPARRRTFAVPCKFFPCLPRLRGQFAALRRHGHKLLRGIRYEKLRAR